MRNTIIVILALVLLSICLLSGGCAKPDQSKIKEWQDLIKIPLDKEKAAQNEKTVLPPKSENSKSGGEKSLQVSLYFADSSGNKLIVEERDIVKVEGIARKTMEELLKGPANVESVQVFPDGTRLRDINIKPDGLCIVDLSAEACGVINKEQERLMIYGIANTLSQFPGVKEISFMIDGAMVDSIGGYIDLSSPIQADYDI